MRQDNFTFVPQFKLTIIGNHKPVLKNVDEAARRRFNLVPFTVQPARKDLLLDDALKVEWPAILRWMIDGCLDWQRHGLIRPESIVSDTLAYFEEQDVFGQWIEDRCDLHPGSKETKASSLALFASWKDYALSAGEDAGSQKTFATKLARRGCEPFRSKKFRGFRGIVLKPLLEGDG